MTDVVRASSARRRTVMGRAVVLAGLGAGFWLLGQTAASADEGTIGLPSALTGEVLTPVVAGTGEVLSAATSTAAEVTPAVVPEATAT